MPLVTIREVAREAGVSTATVSYILNGTERFSYRPATIAKVREAAQRLGYEANGAARLLRQKTTSLIGLTFNIQKTYLNPLVQAAHTELIASGYEPILLDVNRMESDMSAAFINIKMLAGVLSIDAKIGENIPDVYRQLQQSTPIVALYPVASKEIDFVTTDRAAIATMGVRHLFELGHRRIAFATPGTRGTIAQMKLSGWKTALNDYDIEPYAPLLFPVGSIQEIGQSIADQLLALNPRPTALICGGEEVTLSVMSGLARRGVRVPQDISLVSSGLLELGQYSYPTLTTLSVPASEIVQQAVKRLLGRMEENQKEEAGNGAGGREVSAAGRRAFRRLVKPILHVRESTAPLSRGGVS